MLKDEQRKSLLSEYLLALMASVAGFKVSRDNLDHGIDLSILSVRPYHLNGKIRYMNSGKAIDIQVKCTNENAISRTEQVIKYDLEVKNFNDLIIRRIENEVTPLILVIMVLPANIDKWISETDSKYTINIQKYWYYPDMDMDLSLNQRTIRLEIPIENKLNERIIPELFNSFHA